MKKLSFLLLLAALTAVTLFAQSSKTAEQDAIRKAIEDETSALNACDYARWADHWWPETYCYFSVTSPQRHWSMHGWEEISAWAKTATTNCTPTTDNPKKWDYKYAVNGNMAFVTFLEAGGDESTRVLEKRDGKWKLIRMGVVASSSYVALERLQRLQQLAGKWKADLSTMKKEVPSQGWIDLDFYFDIEPTETGIRVKHWRHWKDNDGDHKFSRNWEFATVSEHEDLALFVVQYGSDGFSGAIHGTAKMGKDGSLNALTEKNSEWFTLKPDGKLNLSVDGIDDAGKVYRRFSVDLVRQ